MGSLESYFKLCEHEDVGLTVEGEKRRPSF